MPLKVEFPQDELSHKSAVEWWYFNGHLTADDGHRYSYMNCLFRVTTPLIGKLPINLPQKNYFFYHSMLTDVDNDKLYRHMDHLIAASIDSFEGPLLNVYFAKPQNLASGRHYFIEEPSQFKYRLRGPRLELDLESKQKPLLLDGNGFVDNLGKKTYYYSLTDLATVGHIKLGHKQISVRGQSWMDHQWGDIYPGTDRWNWFAIQLDNNYQILCYEYWRDEERIHRAFIIAPDGKQVSLDDFSLNPGNRLWESPRTKAVYYLDWDIAIPSHKIKLHVSSLVSDHEMKYMAINYWEGPSGIEGTMAGRQVTGNGYIEMVGRKSVLNDLRYARQQFIKKFSKK